VAVLRSQADEADLASITPEMLLVMQMIAGGRDEKLKGKFLREANPTYAGLMRIAKDYERGLATSKAIGEQTAQKGSATAAAVQQTDGRAGAKPKRPEGAGFPKEFYKSHAQSLRKQGKCPWCGGACQGKFCDKKSSEMLCGFCSKKGHLKEVCATQAWEKSGKTVQQAKTVQGDDAASEEDEGAAVSVVTLNTVAAYAPTPRINAEITGSGSSFRYAACPTPAPPGRSSPRTSRRRHGLRPAADRGIKIRAANGDSMACEGTVSINITYKTRTTKTVALISSSLSDEVLVGWQDLVGLAVIHDGFPAQIKVVKARAKNGWT
jgi:hypothetical protein